MFDNLYGFYTEEIVENPNFLFKIYLEVACRIFFNTIQCELFLHVRKVFNQNKRPAARDSCFAVAFYLMLIDLCKKIVWIYASKANPNLLECLFVFYKKRLDFTSESLFFYVLEKVFIFKTFVIDYLLPAEVWVFILTFLLPLDLLNLSCCSKCFYCLFHQNLRYKRRFKHSKRLVNFGKMHLVLTSELEDFLKKLYSKHPHFFTEQMFADLKKKLAHVLFKMYTISSL